MSDKLTAKKEQTSRTVIEATNRADVVELARKDPKVLQAIHNQAFGAWVMGQLYGNDELLKETAPEYVFDALSEMRPRDVFERLLVHQCLWTHVRIGQLSQLAGQQKNRDSLRIVNEAADRALNTFRRMMLAFAEYRSPRPAPSFVKQQNLAQNMAVQQVVSVDSEEKNKTKIVANEKETLHAPIPTKALPADTGTTRISPRDDTAYPALAMGNGTEDAGRQGQEQQERSETRRAKPRSHRKAKAVRRGYAASKGR
jgi:hypothetical protein